MIKSYDAAIRNQLETFSLESKKFCGKEIFIMCEKGSGHYKLVKQYIIENFDKMSDHEQITKIMSF